jgi:hypothetical protein
VIETKIKCDSDYHYSSHKQEVPISEGVKDGWWELEITPDSINNCTFMKISQPKQYNANAKHACCADHARTILQEEISKIVINKGEPDA